MYTITLIEKNGEREKTIKLSNNYTLKGALQYIKIFLKLPENKKYIFKDYKRKEV